MRLRGMECELADRAMAEAFYCRKLVVEVPDVSTIDGVLTVPLRRIPDERGTIFHMLRADDPHFVAVRRDLLHERLRGRRQGVAQAS